MNVCTNIHKINLNNFVTFYSTNNQSRAVYRVVNAASKAYNKKLFQAPVLHSLNTVLIHNLTFVEIKARPVESRVTVCQVLRL